MSSWSELNKLLIGGIREMSKLISDKFVSWEQECNDRFNTLKANEEELNRIFIDIYGLQDELTPEVEDKDVTVRKADLGREIRSLISYAVTWIWRNFSRADGSLPKMNGLIFCSVVREWSLRSLKLV